ncbi:MAG: hypothetical protein NZ957_06450 [Thaumarchaeota archaeon]|nr:hypothetical protein [Candidatus Calditenuaceae archaeon]MDW8042277.1 hypothetical protein [Nitrososphaerota archaeon]
MKLGTDNSDLLSSMTLSDLAPFDSLHPMTFVRHDRPILGSLVWMTALGMEGFLVLEGPSSVVGGITPLEVVRALDANVRAPKRTLLRITAREVAVPVPLLDLKSSMEDLLKELLRSRSYLAAIGDGSKVVGQLTPGSLHRTLMAHPVSKWILEQMSIGNLVSRVRSLAIDTPLEEVIHLIARSGETLFEVDDGDLAITPASLLRPLSSPETINSFLEDTHAFLSEPLITHRSTLIRLPRVRRDATLHEALKTSVESGVCALKVEDAGFLTIEGLFFGLAEELLASNVRL